MSRLSEVINQSVDAALCAEGFDARDVAAEVWDALDDEDRKQVGTAELVKRIKGVAVKRTKLAIQTAASAQAELPFGVPAAVAMDIEGHKIRLTRTLREHEFERAIAIREEQIKADVAALKEWKDARNAAKPYWSRHPDWTFGQVIDAIMRDLGRKSGKAA